MLTQCRVMAKSSIQTLRDISMYMFDTISLKRELSIDYSSTFQLVVNRGLVLYWYAIIRGHDLGGNAILAEITNGKRMPILPRLKLHFVIWIHFMNAHILPQH